MPARKPASLIVRHETAAEKSARSARESGMRPERGLPVAAPGQLRGHAVAEAVWRRALRTYSELEHEIVTRLDQDLLVDYCMLMDQLAEMDTLRKHSGKVNQIWEQRLGEIDERRKVLRGKIAEARKAEDGEALANQLQMEDAMLADQYLTTAEKALEAFGTIVKLDGRVDRKRALLHTMRQSLYLTPRARAGTAPDKKAEPEAPDDMERLLEDVTDSLNKGRD